MSDTQNSDMLYDVTEYVATITFNRPEQQNTISRDMLARFGELLLEADADEEVRAIVITGTGKFFCAGLDLRGSDITDSLSDRSRRVSPTLDLRNTPPTVLHNIDTPTIAAINGSAAGLSRLDSSRPRGLGKGCGASRRPSLTCRAPGRPSTTILPATPQVDAKPPLDRRASQTGA